MRERESKSGLIVIFSQQAGYSLLRRFTGSTRSVNRIENEKHKNTNRRVHKIFFSSFYLFTSKIESQPFQVNKLPSKVFLFFVFVAINWFLKTKIYQIN